MMKCALVLAVLAAGCLAADVVRIPLLPPGEGNPRNSEGDFITLKDGRILFVYTHFTGGGSDHATAHLAGRFSDDGGSSWTTEDTMILPNEGGQNVMSVSLLRLPTDEIALFYARKNAIDDCIAFMRTSTDEAKTWSEPIRVVREDGYFVLNNDRVVMLSTGRLLAPVSRHTVPGGEFTGAGTQSVWRSDDNGRSWQKSNEVASPSGVVLQEPGVIELKSGRLLMLCRTNKLSQYRSVSDDGGVTWSAAEPSGIISPLSPATFERIPETGDILLAWNDHSSITDEYRGKRTPFTIAISRDEGNTWEHKQTLEDDPAGWYCYTAMHFVEGKVLLGHCAGNAQYGHLNHTQITVLDVEGLYR